MTALIFDLDGTLVDTVYPHVIAWQKALAEFDISVDCEKLHRRIGMSGELLMRESARDAGVTMSQRVMDQAENRHAALYAHMDPKPRPLTGALSLLRHLNSIGARFGIATSGQGDAIQPALRELGVKKGTIVIDGSGDVAAKPAPDIFLKCARKLKEKPESCFVVGDAVWDVLAARRAGMLALGLTCGGYSAQELTQSGAFRVFGNPAELEASLPLFGIP